MIAKKEGSPHLSGLSLLLAEDDRDQATIFKMRFSASGYTIKLASNGEEALTVLATEKPDLIITDLMMPIMDGYDLIRHIKADDRLKSIPLIVLTAVTDADNEPYLRELGVDDFCEKTLRWKAFEERVMAVLDRYKVLG